MKLSNWDFARLRFTFSFVNSVENVFSPGHIYSSLNIPFHYRLVFIITAVSLPFIHWHKLEKKLTLRMKIYFCGSIRGGQQDLGIYAAMIKGTPDHDI